MLDSIRRKLRPIADAWLGRWGYKLVRVSKTLLDRPELELKIDLEYVVSHYVIQAGVSDPFLVQIGAFDGVTNDPVSRLIRERGWRGVLVEPQREAFRALEENYKRYSQLTLLNVAISDRDGTRELYRVQSDVEGLPPWSQQLASFDRETILKHKHGVPDYGIVQGIPNIEELIQVEEVACITFDTLLDHVHADRIDLLQIDAEGYDFELLKLLDLTRIKPRIIQYEHMHLSRAAHEASIRYLVDHGYRIAVEFADTIAYLG